MRPDTDSMPQNVENLQSLLRTMKVILETLDFNAAVQKIVDTILNEGGYLHLGYRIVVLALTEPKTNVLKRISISKTAEAETALAHTPVPFSNIDIPLNYEENLCVKVLKTQQSGITNNWSDILVPAINIDDARRLQDIVGIKASIVYPVTYQGQPQGVIIFSLVKSADEVTEEEKDLVGGYADLIGLAVQNAKLYSQVQDVNEKLKELDQRKNEFLNMATHELRAPMAAIKGYLSMIIEGDTGVIPEKTRGFLTDANAVTERLIRLVGNMLNVARIEENRLVYQIEKLSLSEVTRTVFAEFKGEAVRKNLKFDLIMPPEVKDQVIVDIDRIHEVVANFLSNAIKYTDTGSVTVALSQPDPQHVRVDVTDTGPGISPEEQVKLFQKFARAESVIGKTTGTGLGLYICKRLVEKFNGKIGLISDVGKGSTFWFELPLAEFAPTIDVKTSSDAKPAEKVTV